MIPDDQTPILIDGHDDALVGISDVWGASGCTASRMIYSGDLILETLVFRDGMSIEGAMEFIGTLEKGGANSPIVVFEDHDDLLGGMDA